MKKKALALSYSEYWPAPFISAKGEGKLAEKIISIANENDIPIFENEILSDILSANEIGDFVPEETWEVLAIIFAFVLEKTKK